MKYVFQPERKTVIFFDMNNTLVDKDKSMELSFKETVGLYTARWEPDEPTSLDSMWHSYLKKWKSLTASTSKDKKQGHSLRLLCLKEALQPLPLSDEPILLTHILKEIQSQQAHYVTLFPQVPEVVRQLSEVYKISILSNSPKHHVIQQLESTGLSEWISEDRVFTAGAGLPKKPNPKLFKYALKAMNVQASRAVMVGNTWRIDVFGATRSGMDAVWIHPYHKKKSSQRRIGKERVIIIKRFEQLKDVFQIDS